MAATRRRGDRAAARTLVKQLHSLPSQDPDDPGYRRLRYCRYADDTLLGFAGPKAEAEEIKQRLAAFLRDQLKLTLAQDKTLITHARTGAARFLGYHISVARTDRRTRRPLMRDVAAFLPACVPAARRLRGRPEVPRRAKLALLVAILWVLSPIDLLPHFLPVIGPLDDVVAVVLLLRYAACSIPRPVLLEAWPEDPRMLIRLLDGRRAAAGRTAR